MPALNAQALRSEPFTPPEAPTFRPSAAEFENPLRYIASIRPSAESYGICKVVPPKGWKPPYVLDRSTFRFRTRIQSVHELQDRPDPAEAAAAFQQDFTAFLDFTGRPVRKPPVLGGSPVNLGKLYKTVQKRGGYEAVTQKKAWRDVGRTLQLDEKTNNAAYTLRQVYQKHLLPYEDYDKGRAEQADAHCQPDGGAASDERSSQDRDDAEEAADILNAIMGLSAVPKQRAATRPSKPVGKAKAAEKRDANDLRIPDNIFTLNCELCKGGHHEEQIILCDRCDRGCHMFCLSPPLDKVPEGDWLCPVCVAKDAHGFIEGREYSLQEFEKAASTFKNNFFGSAAAAKQASLDTIEAEFWKVVERADEPVEVLYGADIDTTITGSGFPQKETSDSMYATHGWNLNNLPRLDGTYGSMLRHIEENIPGVVVPWMYIGMMFSSFCWHIEDHMFYSINFHHWGDPKKWYGVPGSAGHLFEEAFRKALPGYFEKQPDLLFHLTTLLSPRILHQYGVPVYSATQHEGEFVITFPNSYHGGFNMGFNCAEAVNFAPADWFRFGRPGTERFRNFRKPSVVSHEGLLMKVAELDHSPETCFWAKQELQRVISEEQQWRCKLWSTGVKRSRRTALPKGFDGDEKDEAECSICHLYLHISGLECDCCPGRKVCLQHADNLCDCSPSKWRLVYRYSLQDLDRSLQQVSTHTPNEGSGVPRADSYAGVVPVALTNASASTSDAVRGAPISGPGIDEASLATDHGKGPSEVQQTPAEQEDPTDCNIKMEDGQTATEGTGEADQASRGQKRKRKGKEKKAAQPMKSYPTRERAKAEAEVVAEAEALDAFSALAELADLAEANPDSANDPVHAHKKQRTGSEDCTPEAPAAAPATSSSSPDKPADPLQAALQAWLQQLQQQRDKWQEHSTEVLQTGGVKVSELDALAAEAEQYLWGTGDMEALQALSDQLADAKSWVSKVYACTKNKPTLASLQPLMERSPAPCSMPAFSKLKEAYQQAQAWLARAAEPLAGTVTELRVLEALCSDASRIAVVMPEAKGLRETMNAARKLAEALRGVLPSSREAGRVRRKGEEPADLQALQAMKAQADALHVTMPEATTLSAALERLDNFQQRAKEYLRTRPALSSLEEMLEEAEGLPAVVPETEALQALVDKAAEWQARAVALAAQKAPLKKMREVLHLGLRMPVEVPQVESLRGEIRRREWEDSAKKAVTGKISLAVLLETLEDAATMGAEESELSIRLQERADRAKALEEQAAAHLTTIQQAFDGTQQSRIPLADLEALVQEGQTIGIKMDSLTELAGHVSTAKAWDQQAASCLTRDQPQQAKHRKQTQPPSLTRVTELLQQHDSLAVAVPHAADLLQKQQQALEWVGKADKALQQSDLQQHSADVQVIVDEGLALGLEMPELTQLDSLVRAIMWKTQVRRALGLPDSPPPKQQHPGAALEPDHVHNASNHAEGQALDEGLQSGPIQNAGTGAEQHDQPLQQAPLQPPLTEGEAPPPAGPVELAALHDDVTAAPQHPPITLAQAEELAEQGHQLPVDNMLLQQLQCLVQIGQHWKAQAAAILPGSHQTSEAGAIGGSKVDAFTVEQVINQGLGINLQLDSLQQLQHVLQQHLTWEFHLQHILQGTAKPAFPDLQQIQAEGHASPIASALLPAVDSLVGVVDQWLSAVQKAIARRSAQTPRTGLEAIAASVQRAQEQMESQLRKLQEQRSQGIKDPQTSGAPAASSQGGGQEEGEHELLCVCQQPYNVDTAMISCDVCEDWYHLRCVGMTQAAAKSMKKYTCPVCLALKGNAEPLEAALAKNWKTRRPTREGLASMLQEAAGLPCLLEEQHIIARLLAAYDRWLGSVGTIARGHEASVRIAVQGHHAAAAAARLPITTLSQMLKSALSVELDTQQVSQRLMRLIKTDRWHVKAEQILKAPRPTVDTLSKVLKEAEAAELILEQDPIGAILLQRHTAGKRWQDQARQVMASLKEHAEQAHMVRQLVIEANTLVQQAAQLQVRLDKDVEKLKEAAKIYCLCRQPYNESRPMLSCDHCNDWFHYDCIGLQPPGDNEDDDEVAPAEYRCPKCCVQAGLPYNLMHKLPQKSLDQLHQLAMPLLTGSSLEQQYQHTAAQAQLPSHEHAAHLAANPHLMRYPSDPQALSQGLQHLRPQAQAQQLGEGNNAFDALRYIQVGSNGTTSEPSGIQLHPGDVPQSTDGGEDWVEQAFAEPAQQVDAEATQAAHHFDSNASASVKHASIQPANSLSNERAITDTHMAGAQQPVEPAATDSEAVQSPRHSGAATEGNVLFHDANNSFAVEPSNPSGQQDGKLMSLLMD